MKFGCLPTEFLLWWRVSLCVCNYFVWALLHRNVWRCSVYELRGKFISVFKYLESVTFCTSHSLFPKCNNSKHLSSCLPAWCSCCHIFFLLHVLLLRMLQFYDFSFKHILSSNLWLIFVLNNNLLITRRRKYSFMKIYLLIYHFWHSSFLV